jgi:tetratricopeptide (TPR) repeat protein
MLAWLAIAAGAEPMSLRPSPEARVWLLPRTRADLVEIGVYHNTAPIGVAVADWRDPALLTARVVDAGGGTTFVELEVDEDVVARLTPRPTGDWTLALTHGTPALTAPRPHPTIEQLFAGVPRKPAPEPTIALTPLLRDARTYALQARAIRFEVPDPTLRLPDGWESLDPVEAPTMKDIERWRIALPTLEDPDLQVAAYFRLGSAFDRLGMEREAAYYFGRGREIGFPPSAMFLRHADASMKIGDYEAARASCRQAWYRDADPERVLQCLGSLALITGEPAPSEAGRALADVATGPTSRLLAGELLLRDGFADEAVPLLEDAAVNGSGPNLDFARLALGDAYLATGDVDRAHDAYQAASHRELGPILEVRELMIRMLRDGAPRWPAWIPQLDGYVEAGGPAGADALFLEAQVQESYVDWEAAAGTLAALWDRYPDLRSSDLPARLLADCTRRTTELDRDGRDAELVAVYGICWRPELADHVSDISLLAQVSRAYERLGLLEQAEAVQLDLTTILAAGSNEDPLELGRLAHLQVRNAEAERALETLDYARKLGDPTAAHRLDLVEAEAWSALGRVSEAETAYRRASLDPAVASEARERLGVLELRAGKCAEALPTVQPRLRRGAIEGEPAGELELLLERCAVKLDRPADAIEAAGLAVARATDGWTPVEAKWLATAIALRTGATLPEGLRSDEATLQAMKTEDESQAAFLARVDAWRKGR